MTVDEQLPEALPLDSVLKPHAYGRRYGNGSNIGMGKHARLEDWKRRYREAKRIQGGADDEDDT